MQAARVVSVVGVLAALAAAFWFMAPREPGGPASASSAKKRPDRGSIAFGVIPTIEDRFVGEPCNRVPGGGLFSLAAFMAEIREAFPGGIGISLGDLTQAPAGMGRRTAGHHYSEVFPRTGVEYVAAGEGELALGTEYLRSVLTRYDGVTLVCANAADANGLPILRGWVLLQSGGRGVLIVAVAAESIEPEIRRRGSDVRILSAEAAVAKARADGLEQAERAGVDVDVFVLAVHGTVDEAAALLLKSPGFTFAAAAHGPMMPDAEPRRVGGVPILYGGRGLRFAWRVMLPGDGGPPMPSLSRVGHQYLTKGSPYAESLATFRDLSTKFFFDEVVAAPGDRLPGPSGGYAGGARCADCHQDVAAQHAASAHGRPSEAVVGTSFAGSTGCIGCHVTAPYFEGGWRGPKDRSDMAGVSCESCHGPGAAHAQTRSKGYGRVDFARCHECHLPDRSPGFDAEAAWKRAGHRLGGSPR